MSTPNEANAPLRRDTLIDRFCDALEKEAAEERAAARAAARLEPITIIISDQSELKRIHELAGHLRQNPVPLLRRHIRCTVRQELAERRAA